MLNKIYVNVKNYIAQNFKFILLIVGIYLLFKVELPYVIYAPGGAIDLGERIEVEGGNKSEGKLQMAYVSMVRGSIPFVLLSNVLPNWDLEKKSDVTYGNESMDEMIERDKIYLQESIDNATISAYKLTNHELTIKKTKNVIVYITEESQTDLKIGDELISVDGVEINSLDEYKSIVAAREIGDSLELKVNRKNKETDCYIKIFETESKEKKTGIMVVNTYEYETDPKLTIKSKSSESGPSGGLMLALGIYNALTDDDITKGRNIVGTGTIDVDGNVGEIGGVKYKLIGAVNKKADIFICPIENYQEAVQVKKDNNYDITIYGVKTLEEAIDLLK